MSRDRAEGFVGSGEGEDEEIRVTDRRRFNTNGEPASSAPQAERQAEDGASQNLKPTYVEQLEARADAAEQKLLEVQARFNQLRDQLQRETDETRQRLARTADERARNEKAAFISGLLPVIDNLKRALEMGDKGSFDALLNGIRSTAAGFESALSAAGVEAIDSVGAPFDPEIHEAVSTIEVEPDRDNQVTAEYSRGYRLNDRLLRPARVQVGYARPKSRPADE